MLNDYLLVKTPTKARNVVCEDTNHGASNLAQPLLVFFTNKQ
jgi:hypothetical protein